MHWYNILVLCKYRGQIWQYWIINTRKNISFIAAASFDRNHLCENLIWFFHVCFLFFRLAHILLDIIVRGRSLWTVPSVNVLASLQLRLCVVNLSNKNSGCYKSSAAHIQIGCLTLYKIRCTVKKRGALTVILNIIIWALQGIVGCNNTLQYTP